ncbi:cytidine deaminase [Enterococcus phage IME-EF4]|uniref:Cytidine deaminase n=1 Tax=Enterococcus phage IME-EF4 TaxID=1432658 RepID=V5UQM1_9CAUD|nr:cytidine deaminase [Enterococcus phage IME-EF4]AHB79811.1 cytidine deaminase [Enterococcus phage IME-EF4]
MKYTENDIKVGTKMTCIDNNDTHWWTNGKIYEVKKSKLPTSGICIIDDQDSERYLEGILARLNNASTGVQFEIIDEEEEMQYTEKDLKEGTKLRCTHSKPAHWTVGKVYEVSSDNIGELSITDNDGSPAFKNYMLDCLNGNHNPVSFEIVEEEKEEPVALIEVDTLKLIEAKIEQLRDEQENLHNKRMRIKHQEEALRDKRMKLVESKKAFEFLKQQKFL